jgi:hypothetical protein
MDISQKLRDEATGEYGVLPPVRYIPLMLSAANEIDDLTYRLEQNETDYVDISVAGLDEIDAEKANADQLADALHLLMSERGCPSHLVDVVFDALENHDNRRQKDGIN